VRRIIVLRVRFSTLKAPIKESAILKLRKIRLFLHFVCPWIFSKPNMVADFFGATINDSNKKFSEIIPSPQQQKTHPAQRSVSWLDEHFGEKK